MSQLPLKLLLLASGVALVAWAVSIAFRPAAPIPTERAGVAEADWPGDAPRRMVSSPGPGTAARPESRLERMLRGEELVLSETDLASYLEANGRSAESLLVAARLTGNQELLKEAQTKFPGRPQVAFASWMRSQDPDEKRAWLEAMSKGDPENALPHYLLSAMHFKNGQQAEGLEQLQAAANKPGFSYYGRESMLDTEEALRSAGYSEAEAKLAGGSNVLLPHLSQVKNLAIAIGELSQTYRQAGDTASADAALNLGFELAERQGPQDGLLIEQLVGIAAMSILLKQADPAAPSHIPGKTNGQLTQDLQARKDLIKQLAKDQESLWPKVTEADISAFHDRTWTLGELKAMQWLQSRYSK